MWGMYIGMDLARRQGITHLQVESDSKVLVDMVTGNCNVNGNIPTLIKRIRYLKNMNWHVQFNHTWREGNRSADWLANFSLTLNSLDLHVLGSPPRELQRKRSELACLDSTTNSLARPSPCDVGSFSFKSRTLMVKQSQV
ncbi:heat shock 70 kDa protein [Trifolium repens]|nr:heat shock 70 kDa protein [Trifolium repens]